MCSRNPTRGAGKGENRDGMLKWTGTMALMALLAVAFLTSCVGQPNYGGTTTTSSTTSAKPAGSLITLVGDTPGLCDVVSYPISFTHLSLVGPYQIGTVPINSGLVNPPQIRINLGCLRDFTTPLVLSSASPGTFNLAVITLVEPNLFFFDSTVLPPNPPITIPNFTMSPLKNIQLPVSPPLVISNGVASVLKVDFDMAHMIQSILRQIQRTGSSRLRPHLKSPFRPSHRRGARARVLGNWTT